MPDLNGYECSMEDDICNMNVGMADINYNLEKRINKTPVLITIRKNELMTLRYQMAKRNFIQTSLIAIQLRRCVKRSLCNLI